ncbi:MAG: hypothetical protein ACI9DO_003347, partial [Reinekea sp.]
GIDLFVGVFATQWRDDGLAPCNRVSALLRALLQAVVLIYL